MRVLTRTGESNELSYLQAKGSLRHVKESERFITLAPIISFPLAKIILACVFSDFPEAL